MLHDTHANTNAKFKYLGIYLSKEMKDTQNKLQDTERGNYRRYQTTKKTFHAPGLAELVLWKGYTTKINLVLTQHLPKF